MIDYIRNSREKLESIAQQVQEKIQSRHVKAEQKISERMKRILAKTRENKDLLPALVDIVGKDLKEVEVQVSRQPNNEVHAWFDMHRVSRCDTEEEADKLVGKILSVCEMFQAACHELNEPEPETVKPDIESIYVDMQGIVGALTYLCSDSGIVLIEDHEEIHEHIRPYDAEFEYRPGRLQYLNRSLETFYAIESMRRSPVHFRILPISNDTPEKWTLQFWYDNGAISYK